MKVIVFAWEVDTIVFSIQKLECYENGIHSAISYSNAELFYIP